MNRALIVFAVPFLLGVSSIRFLWQAMLGQLEILNRSRPIEEVLKDERISSLEKFYLSHVGDVKKFGEKYYLKPTSNYAEYVKLNREAVVWVVTASHPLKFEPKIWSFPIVGSFNYIGFFEKKLAQEKGKLLEEEGFDVYVRGASAFSTLGWMKDPVLSTMFNLNASEIGSQIGELINTVLHESVHATYYVPNQSYFNESLASFVADQLTESFFKEKSVNNEDWKRYFVEYVEGLKNWDERKKNYHELVVKLEEVYKSPLKDEEKLREKKELIKSTQERLKLKGQLNNAQLIQFKTYNAAESYFLNVFQKTCASQWVCFWDEVKKYQFSKPQLEVL